MKEIFVGAFWLLVAIFIACNLKLLFVLLALILAYAVGDVILNSLK